jgi:putative ABC transport system permease protein
VDLYSALLRLLPRDRRRQHGAQMAVTFADLAADARRGEGRRGVVALWTAEAMGLLRFSWREWTTRLRRMAKDLGTALASGGGPRFGSELGWAWRAVRTRGWRGALVVGLFGLAIGANAIVFAAADSFVFNRVPYRYADRLVEIGEQHPLGWSDGIFPELVPVWRRQSDLFAAVQAHEPAGSIYLTGGDEPHFVGAEEVTPGLFDMLGARPRWGRLFTAADALPNAEPVAIVAEDVAAEEFGDARLALGRTLPLLPKPARIVGVMPDVFRFPTGQERIWAPLDLTIPSVYLAESIALLAPGATLDVVSRAVAARAPSLTSFVTKEHAGRRAFPAAARSIAPALVDSRLRRLFALLTAAAGCLLLVACGNVVNLELGSAVRRARTVAVSLALGASRGTLIRTVLLEGAIVVAAATALAVLLTWQVTAFIAAHLPATMTNALPNPIHVDTRTLGFMTAIASVAWLVASLPVSVLASRTNMLNALKLDSRSLSTSRGGVRVRHLLTITEIALTVLLLIGAGLSVHTYSNVLNLPKGFDAANVITVAARQRPAPPETKATLQGQLLDGLRARPDVISAAVADASPPTTGARVSNSLTVGTEGEPRGSVTLDPVEVGPEYFQTLRLPILAGRAFGPADRPDAVVVDEAFARRYWPAGHAVGTTFHLGRQGADFGSTPDKTIIGVAAHARTVRDSVTQPSESEFTIYLQLEEDYTPLSLVARLSDGESVDSVQAMLRALSPTTRFRVERMTDRYAATFADEQLASSVMTAFGGLAFVVAAAGVYGVMAFLVAARAREIGVRIALGADRSAVRRLVMKSSLVPVLVGATIGMASAAIAVHWARSLYFGISAATPTTFAGVGLLIVLTAVAATWQPARQAERVDPSRLLRE